MLGMMLKAAIRSLILGAVAWAGVSPAATPQSGNAGTIISGGKTWGDQVLINRSPGEGVPTLGEIKTLSPQMTADRVLGKLTHGPVASVSQRPGTFGPIELVEGWTRVPEGCRRLRWNANFLLAPNSPPESAWVAVVNATPEIALATSNGCENVQAYVTSVDADTSFKMLGMIGEIIAGKREATFDCKGPAVQHMCSNIEVARAELAKPPQGSPPIGRLNGVLQLSYPSFPAFVAGVPPLPKTITIRFDPVRQDDATVTFEEITLPPPPPAGAPRPAAARRLPPPPPTFFPLHLWRTPASVPAQPQPSAPGTKAYVDGNYPEALRLLTPLADQGDALAMHQLSQLYFSGYGVPQDNAKGLALLRRAAEARDERPYGGSTVSGAAMNRLATLFETGVYGITQDMAEAANWWRRWGKTSGDITAPMVLAERNIQP